jgi:hypothetical protein
LANVGLFHTYLQPPLVPDNLLAIRATVGKDLHKKENHSYFMWLQGKAPNVVVEIVSDRRGGEDTTKMREYARIQVTYYVIHDPRNCLRKGVLRAFVFRTTQYEPLDPIWFPDVGIGMSLWEGEYEHLHATWLRWCDQFGQVIPTGAERVHAASRRARRDRRRADEERHRNEELSSKVKRLAAQLRRLGVDPEP